MSRFMRVASLLLAGLAIGFVAQAQQVPVAASSVQSPQQKAVVKPGDRNCIRDTGSRIPAKPGHCLPVGGRSYSQQDLQNTGEIELGPALQKLDPSVTVRGH